MVAPSSIETDCDPRALASGEGAPKELGGALVRLAFQAPDEAIGVLRAWQARPVESQRKLLRETLAACLETKTGLGDLKTGNFLFSEMLCRMLAPADQIEVASKLKPRIQNGQAGLFFLQGQSRIPFQYVMAEAEAPSAPLLGRLILQAEGPQLFDRAIDYGWSIHHAARELVRLNLNYDSEVDSRFTQRLLSSRHTLFKSYMADQIERQVSILIGSDDPHERRAGSKMLEFRDRVRATLKMAESPSSLRMQAP